MTVADLVAALLQQDQAATVVTWGMDKNGYAEEAGEIFVGKACDLIWRGDPDKVAVLGGRPDA